MCGWVNVSLTACIQSTHKQQECVGQAGQDRAAHVGRSLKGRPRRSDSSQGKAQSSLGNAPKILGGTSRWQGRNGR